MAYGTTKKLIMVSSRFGGKEENIARAEKFCKYVISKGHIPIAPHVYFPRFLNDLVESERELGLEGSLALMSRCDEVWFFLDDNEKLSPGMKLEASLMVELEMPYKVICSTMAINEVDFPDEHRFVPRCLGSLNINNILLNDYPKDQFDDHDWHLIYRNDNC